MTTDRKTRITVWLYDRRPLDDLTEQLRRLAPLEDRGRISRSTVIEAAIAVALADLLAHGRDAVVYSTLVTSP
jgi:hypothetical protein